MQLQLNIVVADLYLLGRVNQCLRVTG